MPRQLAHCLAVATTAFATSASAATLFQESFEDGALDPRVSISTVGTFNAAPGIKLFAGIEGDHAFGFGRSTNRFNSFGSYVTNFTIDLGSPTFVNALSFDEKEIFDNWGSRGEIYIDGTQVLPTPAFGRDPYNNRQADSDFRSHTFLIDRPVQQIRIQVWDITDLSEIYVDNVTVTGVPEPQSALLLMAGLLLLAKQRLPSLKSRLKSD
jgi:hypothetical protein